LDNKTWKPIPGYEDRYLCSEGGEVFSLFCNKVKGKRLSNNGYFRVNLYKKCKQETALIHSVVARTFLGKRLEGMQINHKDGNKTNNHLSNLEYVTCKENINHAARIGLFNSVGENNPSCKLLESEVLDIQLMLNSKKFEQQQIADKYQISKATISAIATGRVWGTVTGIVYCPKKRKTQEEWLSS